MTKSELIERLQSLPNTPDDAVVEVCICDEDRNMLDIFEVETQGQLGLVTLHSKELRAESI